MRLVCHLFILSIVLLAAGCAPEALGPSADGAVNLVAGITVINPDSNQDGVTAPSPPPAGASTAATGTTLSGSVAGDGEYQLFELGTGVLGEQWTIAAGSGFSVSQAYIAVLFDDQYQLLQRQIVSNTVSLQHLVRRSTSRLYLGVAPAFSSAGGSFTFDAQRRGGVPVPPPRQQAVWLNFGAGSNVSVHGRDALSFPAFDAATLSPKYAGQTEQVKAAVIAAMREDYAAYDVVLLTSDDGPPPTGPHATVHLGGSDSALLGLADNVDQYNSDPWQTAVVYVNGFADFAGMNLPADEMGQMIGNTASHELGHLLGLFHTQAPKDLMDTTGTAWDLAADQSFTRGPLEPSVFPFGFENSPDRLADAVGHRVGAKPDAAKPLTTEKALRKASLRAMMRVEFRSRCGNCLDPDG